MIASYLCLILATVPANPASELAPRSVGEWLLDQSRDVTLAADSPNSEPILEAALTFANAASTIEPDLPEAHLRRYDLNRLLERRPAALGALERYVTLAPSDESAWLEWIALQLDPLQTADDRDRFCRHMLERTDLPAAVASDLHRRLAEAEYNRGQRSDANRHAESAVRELGLNLAAARVRLACRGDQATPADRIGLHLIRMHTLSDQAQAAWDLARELDELSLHDLAWFWYRLALRSSSGSEVRLDLAESLIDGGKPNEAIAPARQVIASEPNNTRAYLLLARAGKKLGHDALTHKSLAAVGAVYDRLGPQVFTRRDPEQAATIAFYFAYYERAAGKAEAFARLAAPTDDSAALVKLAAGYAALLTDRHADVDRFLAPLAATSQLAAVGWAESLLARDKEARAVEVLTRAAAMRYSGDAFDRLAELLKRSGHPVPSRPSHDDVRTLLAKFDRRVLQYVQEPARYLRLTLSFSPARPVPGQRWRCRFILENIGPFPIALGRNLMVSPVVLLSATVNRQPAERIDHFLAIPLTGQLLLAPGHRVERVRTVDVGPLRRALDRQAGEPVSVDFTAILDPQPNADGQLTHGPGGQTISPIRVEPLPVASSPAALRRMMADLQTGTVEVRRRTIPRAAGWLAADSRRQVTVARRIHAGLLATLADPDWRVRAAATDAVGRVEPNRLDTRQLAQRLSDRHWLVRMLAVHRFAALQGPVFAPVARRLARHDPHPLVRRLARAHLHAWAEPR